MGGGGSTAPARRLLDIVDGITAEDEAQRAQEDQEVLAENRRHQSRIAAAKEVQREALTGIMYAAGWGVIGGAVLGFVVGVRG